MDHEVQHAEGDRHGRGEGVRKQADGSVVSGAPDSAQADNALPPRDERLSGSVQPHHEALLGDGPRAALSRLGRAASGVEDLLQHVSIQGHAGDAILASLRDEAEHALFRLGASTVNGRELPGDARGIESNERKGQGDQSQVQGRIQKAVRQEQERRETEAAAGRQDPGGKHAQGGAESKVSSSIQRTVRGHKSSGSQHSL